MFQVKRSISYKIFNEYISYLDFLMIVTIKFYIYSSSVVKTPKKKKKRNDADQLQSFLLKSKIWSTANQYPSRS